MPLFLFVFLKAQYFSLHYGLVLKTKAIYLSTVYLLGALWTHLEVSVINVVYGYNINANWGYGQNNSPYKD